MMLSRKRLRGGEGRGGGEVAAVGESRWIGTLGRDISANRNLRGLFVVHCFPWHSIHYDDDRGGGTEGVLTDATSVRAIGSRSDNRKVEDVVVHQDNTTQATGRRKFRRVSLRMMFYLSAGILISLTLVGATEFSPAPVYAATQGEDGAASASFSSSFSYATFDELAKQIESLGRAYPNSLRIQSIGKSREGRDIWSLTLALDSQVDPDRRPALLITAGIDGNHLVGSAVAVETASELLVKMKAGDEGAMKLLSDHVVYIVPRVNPDGMERYFGKVKDEFSRNIRPDDKDRDMVMDEDGPNDLNGDGMITMMRVYNPDEADLMADPADDRLNVKPDGMKGERSAFKLYIEGIDDDGDGALNEDGLGGVDLNKNFMHGYPEHEDGAGPYPVSEPESLSLLKFVLSHQNIAIVLTYGRHDNLSKAPDGKGTFKAGTPKNILSDDVAVYKAIGEKFREITKLKKAPSVNGDGAFFSWAYAQFGVPSFTTPLWTGPEGVEAGGKRNGGKAAGDGDEVGEVLEASGVGDIAQVTLDELIDAAEAQGMEVSDDMMAQITPQQIEQFAGMMGIEVKHVKKAQEEEAATAAASKDEEKSEDGKEKENEPRDKAEAAWLKYNDEERDGEGFINWSKFNHPRFGEVEIGGWVPHFKTNPPAGEVAEIAAKEVDFVLDLAGRFPQVSLTEPKITHLTGGLYEIEVSLVNDGFFPTGTAMAVQNRRARPYVVRLSTPIANIITGQRVHKVWKIEGNGGRYKIRWIVRAPDASKHTITVYSEKYGEFEREISLIPTAEKR